MYHSPKLRPRTEHAIEASSPFLTMDIAQLKRFQLLTTRILEGCQDLSYEERFEKLFISPRTSKTERLLNPCISSIERFL